MRPGGKAGELFAAYSRITARAFMNDKLLACPTLAKTPHSGDVLRRYVLGQRRGKTGPGRCLLLVLRYCAANFLHFVFLLLAALFIRLLRWPRPEALRPGPKAPDRPAPLVIDTFAVLPRLAAEKTYRELYLPGLEQAARARGRETVTLFRLYGSRNPLILWRAFRVLAGRGGGLTEVHLFRPGDWARLFWHLFAYPFALARLIRSLAAFAPDTPELFIREALVATAGQCALIGEARRIAAYRLGLLLAARPAAPGPGLLAWYENQTVDKCLLRGLDQAARQSGRRVPVIGAQLFIWPDTLLNNHPDDGEAALGLAPDKVLVNGPHFLPDDSPLAGRYAVGPSLRYGHLFAREAAPEQDSPVATPAPGQGPLLALLSYHPEETRRVLELLLPLAEAGQDIVYRFHPAVRPDDYAALLPHRPRLSEGPLDAALHSAGAVIGAGSGALAEAVAQGLPVLAVTAAVPGLDLNYLPEYGRGLLWASVSRAGELAPVLDALRANAAGPDREAHVRAFRDLLFTEPTPERICRAFEL